MIIKQPPQYILQADLEEYDYTLIKCGNEECSNLCETGVGQCDRCLNYSLLDIEKHWAEILNGQS